MFQFLFVNKELYRVRACCVDIKTKLNEVVGVTGILSIGPVLINVDLRWIRNSRPLRTIWIHYAKRDEMRRPHFIWLKFDSYKNTELQIDGYITDFDRVQKPSRDIHQSVLGRLGVLGK